MGRNVEREVGRWPMAGALLAILLLAVATDGLAATASRIPVTQAGIYRVLFEQVLTAPIPSAQLHLTNRGSEVAILVQDVDNDGLFGPGDSFLFYGDSLKTSDPEFRYTNENAYVLSSGTTPPVRMATWASGSPLGTAETSFRDTFHAEQNWVVWQTMPNGGDADHWFWGYDIGMGQQQTYTLTLSYLVDAGIGYTLRVALYGRTNVAASPDHTTRIWLNNTVLGEAQWDGQTPKILTFDNLAPNLFKIGANEIIVQEVINPAVVVDSVFVDWFELDYDRSYPADGNALAFTPNTTASPTVAVSNFSENTISVFNITDPALPSVLDNPAITADSATYTVTFSDNTPTSPARYLAVANSAIIAATPVIVSSAQTLASPDNGADYIIVTHATLKSATQALADYRAGQGYRVKTVTTQEIYDQFSDGIFTPVAIQSFLRYAYQHWQKPAPKFVVLIGDANMDFKDYYHTGQINQVPTYLVDTSVGQTTSDNSFVTLEGNDPIPEMLIGRIPAKTAAQVNLVVQKIITYEASAGGSWKSRLLMASGDQDPRFKEYSDEWRSHVPSKITTIEIALADYAPSLKKTAFSDFIHAVNSGVGLITYFGHGASDRWQASDTATLISSDNVGILVNPAQTPIYVAFNCLNSVFAQPKEGGEIELPDRSIVSYDVPLAEALMFTPNVPSVALWSPSALAYPSEQRWIGDEFFKAIYQDKKTILGEVTTQALVRAYQSNGISAENFDVFTLIGDPATHIDVTSVSTDTGSGDDGSGGGGEFLWTSIILLGWIGFRRRNFIQA